MLAIQAVAISQTFHFPRRDRRVMAKDFDALERKQPTRICRRSQGRVHPAFEYEQYRKIVDFRVLMARTNRLHTLHFTKQETKHVEHVNSLLVQKTARDFWITDPFRIQQLTAIHFHVGRMRTMTLSEHSF